MRWWVLICYLNTLNIDTMELIHIRTRPRPSTRTGQASCMLIWNESTAMLARIILKHYRQDFINLSFAFISDWALSDWANTVLENFKCQKLMELNGAFVEGINWNKISLFSTFQNISEIKFQLFVKKLSNVVPTELSKSFKIWTFNQLFPVSRSKECWQGENALYSEFFYFTILLVC